MKLRAMGRDILIETDQELVDEFEKKSIIALPDEFTEKLKGGTQISTILSMGDSVYDDESPYERGLLKPGRKTVTARYPGNSVDIHPERGDKDIGRLRTISCSEIRSIEATEEEGGVDV